MLVLAWWIAEVRAGTLEFVTAGDDEIASQVDLIDGNRRRLLERFAVPRRIVDSEVSPDGALAVVVWQVAETDPAVTLYDTAGGKVLGTFASPASRPTDVQFSVNNNIIVQGTCGTNCAEFDVVSHSGRSLLPANFPRGPAYEVSPGRNMAISYPNPYGPEEATGASVLSLVDGHVIASVTNEALAGRTVSRVEWTPTGARVALAGPGGTFLLDLRPASNLPPVVSAYPTAEAARELRVTVGGKTSTLVTWRNPVRLLNVVVSPNGTYVLAVAESPGKATALVYEVASGRQTGAVDTDSRAMVTWSPKGTLVVAGGCGTDCHTVQVFDVTGKVLGKPLGGGVTATSPSGAYLLFYPNEGSDPVPVSLLDLATGEVVASFPGTTPAQLRGGDVVWSSDGTVAVLTLQDGKGATRQLRVAADGTCAWVAP